MAPPDGDAAAAARPSPAAELRRHKAVCKELRATLHGLRSAPVQPIALAALPAACPLCASEATLVSSYPAERSALFARLLVCWCQACGFGWVPQLPFDLDAYYARDYAACTGGVRAIDPEALFCADQRPPRAAKLFDRAGRQIRLLEQTVALDHLLDFGAGPGYALAQSRAGCRHAIEPDRACAKYLDHIGAAIVALDALPADFYDGVLASHAIEHLTVATLLPTLHRLIDALKAGGVLYIEVPAAGLLRHVVTTKQEPHTLFFTPEALKRLVARLGLDVVFAGAHGAGLLRLRCDARLYEPSDDDPFFASNSPQITVLGRKPSGWRPPPAAMA